MPLHLRPTIRTQSSVNDHPHGPVEEVRRIREKLKMPPKKKQEPNKKTVDKAKEKIIEVSSVILTSITLI